MINAIVPQDWTPQLALAIADSIRAFFRQFGDELLAMFAIDCHPWNGHIGLAALTKSEADSDKLLMNPAEMAAWKSFDFAREYPSWKPTLELGKLMRSRYEMGDHNAVAAAFFDACADAMKSKIVNDVLNSLGCDHDIKISVANPDDGREFM